MCHGPRPPSDSVSGDSPGDLHTAAPPHSRPPAPRSAFHRTRVIPSRPGARFLGWEVTATLQAIFGLKQRTGGQNKLMPPLHVPREDSHCRWLTKRPATPSYSWAPLLATAERPVQILQKDRFKFTCGVCMCVHMCVYLGGFGCHISRMRK